MCTYFVFYTNKANFVKKKKASSDIIGNLITKIKKIFKSKKF